MKLSYSQFERPKSETKFETEATVRLSLDTTGTSEVSFLHKL